jgi:uncharacterized membrane protein
MKGEKLLMFLIVFSRTVLVYFMKTIFQMLNFVLLCISLKVGQLYSIYNVFMDKVTYKKKIMSRVYNTYTRDAKKKPSELVRR